MGILSGIDEAKNQLNNAEKALAGRLASVVLSMSTRSSPPLNYYKLTFEENVRSLKGSAPTQDEFDYQQTGKGGQRMMLLKEDGESEPVSPPQEHKEPKSGQFYVAIVDSDDNKIKQLIEIDENDAATL